MRSVPRLEGRLDCLVKVPRGVYAGGVAVAVAPSRPVVLARLWSVQPFFSPHLSILDVVAFKALVGEVGRALDRRLNPRQILWFVRSVHVGVARALDRLFPLQKTAGFYRRA